MIKNILFTKYIPKDTLEDLFAADNDIFCMPTLKINLNSVEKISKQIDYSINQYIVTSQNTVEAIRELKLHGTFFVVGEKTAEKIIEQNRKIILTADNVEKLAEKIILHDYFPKWNLLCGSSRRDELINILKKANHEVNEVITYYSEQINYQLRRSFDAYVFFSPLSFKAFTKLNIIPKNSFIFTVGSTTTSAIKEVYPDYNIITADVPMIEAVIEKIKRYR